MKRCFVLPLCFALSCVFIFGAAVAADDSITVRVGIYENRPKIFTDDNGNASGLGLSICYGILAEHRGRIWAESEPGKGATFVVELPIVTEIEAPDTPEPVADEPEKAGEAKILMVDDEQVICDLAKRILTKEGYQVDTVNNAAEALEKIKTRRYNLILLDIKMPGMSGIQLYQRLQKIVPSLAERVLFVTGDVIGTDTKSFLSQTKAPYINKPFDTVQLKKEIGRLLPLHH